MSLYHDFLVKKQHLEGEHGFAPVWMPSFLFDFQRALVDWALRKGRCAIFADCGLGKTPMQLVWAQNIVQHTQGRVLILTPLAVSYQTVEEAKKFGVEAERSIGPVNGAPIVVTNYERLGGFSPSDFVGVVCDESSILKNFDGATKAAITDFMRKLPYRLLCTATPSPNDFIELGTSSEALGYLGYMDMLGMFFKNDQHSLHPATRTRFHCMNVQGQWRFKPHAERPFWRWVCSWARALRKPSDLGFSDEKFHLEPLHVRQHIVSASRPLPGYLFSIPAHGLSEQRQERRHTIHERCERVAQVLAGREQALAWCHLNDEGDLLTELIPGAVQVSGDERDAVKEEKFMAFVHRDIRVLVTKPTIGGMGLNLQQCHRMSFFPSHSFEQYYQGVRRCWRFGQTRPVYVELVTSEGETDVMANLQRKAQAAERMFTQLVAHMSEELQIGTRHEFPKRERLPSWLHNGGPRHAR